MQPLASTNTLLNFEHGRCMTEETTFANEAWKLLRSKGSRPALQDLIALRPRPKPGSKLDETALTLLTVYIYARTTLGSEENRIVHAWVHGPGM